MLGHVKDHKEMLPGNIISFILPHSVKGFFSVKGGSEGYVASHQSVLRCHRIDSHNTESYLGACCDEEIGGVGVYHRAVELSVVSVSCCHAQQRHSGDQGGSCLGAGVNVVVRVLQGGEGLVTLSNSTVTAPTVTTPLTTPLTF